MQERNGSLRAGKRLQKRDDALQFEYRALVTLRTH